MTHFYFPFYPDRFITGTLGLTTEERGAYIMLLCYQFDNGAIPTDKDELALITGTDIDLMRVLRKFPDGINKKMSEVKERGEVISAIRKQSGSKGIAKRWQNDGKSDDINVKSKYKPKDKDKERERDANASNARKFVKPGQDDIKAYCIERKNCVDPSKFYNHYESNGWRVGKNPMKDWRAAVRNWESGDNSGNKRNLPPEPPKPITIEDIAVPPPPEALAALKQFSLRSLQ